MLQGYSVRKLNLETQAGSLADNREERMVWESVEWSRHQIETRAEEGPEQRGSKMRQSGPQPAVPEGGRGTGNAIKQLERGPQDEGVATPRSKQSICHPAQRN